MCKFCNKNKKIRVMSYDNRDSMNIYYGQYQGVSVDSNLYLQGDMLILSAFGSYRSKSDCYYEDCGLDCDSENATNSESTYIKIEYCPFCGKKLNSNLYDLTKTKDDIIKIENELDKLKNDLNESQIFINIYWEDPGLVKPKNGGIYFDPQNHSKTYKHIEYDNTLKLTIQEIEKIYQNIKFNIAFGGDYNLSGFMYKKSFQKYEKYDLNIPVKMKYSSYGTFKSIEYVITDKVYNKLKELGYIKVNSDKKFEELKKIQAELKDRINELKNKLSKLNQHLNELKNENSNK